MPLVMFDVQYLHSICHPRYFAFRKHGSPGLSIPIIQPTNILATPDTVVSEIFEAIHLL
jgi:hypothetical protein